jgi:hypothetical protein
MNNLAFIASVVGSLAIPVTVVVALLIFRGPLTELLGRIVSYEGLGQRVNFGLKLAGAEKSVSKAVVQAQETVGRTQVGSAETERTPVDRSLRAITSTALESQEIDLWNAGLVELATLATSNPSFVVLRSWDDLETSLTSLVRSVFPSTRDFKAVSRLPDLVKEGYVDQSFVNAVRDLRGLRNNVAHGQHNPTAGEAVTYLESARELSQVARLTDAELRGRKAAEQKIDATHSSKESDRASE